MTVTVEIRTDLPVDPMVTDISRTTIEMAIEVIVEVANLVVIQDGEKDGVDNYAQTLSSTTFVSDDMIVFLVRTFCGFLLYNHPSRACLLRLVVTSITRKLVVYVQMICDRKGKHC